MACSLMKLENNLRLLIKLMIECNECKYRFSLFRAEYLLSLGSNRHRLFYCDKEFSFEISVMRDEEAF